MKKPFVIQMPKAVENEKGFFVIPISQKKVIEIFNGFGICDSCATVHSPEGYLCPVLGSKWYCTDCYNRWQETAINYPEDKEYEQMVLKRLENQISLFEIQLIDELNSIKI